MFIKTIVAAGICAIASVAAAQTPSGAPLGMDYFSSGSYQGGVVGGNTTRTTGTQGVVGNPNCPQPVEPGGIRPLNWSCPTGTQAGSNNTLAQGVNQNQRVNPNQRGFLLGTGPGNAGAVPGNPQQAQQRAQQQAQQQALQQQAQRRQQAASNRPYVPSGGAGVNQRLQAAFDRLNGSNRMQLINGAADFMGQRRLEAGSQRSTYGTRYGYGIPAQTSVDRGYGRGRFGNYSGR